MTIRMLDLFAGIGGFRAAAEGLGIECVGHVEIDARCRNAYRALWGEGLMLSDIRNVTRPRGRRASPSAIRRRLPDHDMLCAGFPCQPFSKAGAQGGAGGDLRGTLYQDILAVVQAKQPRWVVLENVRNLVGERHLPVYRAILGTLKALGYHVHERPLVLSPHHLEGERGGGPITRDRVFILADRECLPREAALPPKDRLKAGDWRLGPYLEPAREDVPEWAAVREDELRWLDAWGDMAQRLGDDVPTFPLWLDAMGGEPAADVPAWKRKILDANAALYMRRGPDIAATASLQGMRAFPASRRKLEWQAHGQGFEGVTDIRRMVVTLRPSGVRVKAPTTIPSLSVVPQVPLIGPSVSRGGNGVTGAAPLGRWQRLLPVEAARLMGFHDPARAAAAVPGAARCMRMLGNAVHVGVATHVMASLVRA